MGTQRHDTQTVCSEAPRAHQVECSGLKVRNTSCVFTNASQRLELLLPERQMFGAHVSGGLYPLASLLPAPFGIRSFGKVWRKHAKVVPGES